MHPLERRLCWAPNVYLVGQQTIDQKELDTFLADESVAQWETDTDVGGEKLAEVAGRVCYMSFARPRPGGNAAYLHHLLEVGHGSVLEHSVFSLIFTGVSRSFTHELVRHRVGMSYSQLSQRFVDEGECRFVVPPALFNEVEAALSRFRQQPPAEEDPLRGDCGEDWLRSLCQAENSYASVVAHLTRRYAAEYPDLDPTARRKAVREAARSVLPNAAETKIFVTANARALRHFLEMRGSDAAEAEINRQAYCLLAVLRDASPNLFSDYRVLPGRLGKVNITTEYKKV